MRLLVPGGTGSTGRALIERLRAGGGRVELTVVSRSAVAVPGADRVVTGRYADLARSAEFRRSLGTFDAVDHLADGLGTLQERQHARDTGLADRLLAESESLALAVREAGVPLFVYVSSIKALCDEDDGRVLVETSDPHATTAYGASKLRLEKLVKAALAGSDTRWVILRNPVMYSSGKPGSFHRLLQAADTPLPLPLGGLSNRRSVLYVPNFASALAAVVRAGRNAPQGVFHVHDGPALSTTEIVETMRRALGRPARLFDIGAAGARYARGLPLLGASARRLYGSLELSDALFRQTFKWAPDLDTRTAIAEMAVKLARSC